MKLIDEELDVFPLQEHKKIFDLPVISGVKLETGSQGIKKLKSEEIRIAMFMIINTYKKNKVMYNNISEINFSDSGSNYLFDRNSIPFIFQRNRKHFK
ncbi:MAG: hypothetical protein IPG09_16305 [Ignavibacteria bacterium]|nr:hypothetical protein [Ignavibacteria bacterium]